MRCSLSLFTWAIPSKKTLLRFLSFFRRLPLQLTTHNLVLPGGPNRRNSDGGSNIRGELNSRPIIANWNVLGAGRWATLPHGLKGPCLIINEISLLINWKVNNSVYSSAATSRNPLPGGINFPLCLSASCWITSDQDWVCHLARRLQLTDGWMNRRPR